MKDIKSLFRQPNVSSERIQKLKKFCKPLHLNFKDFSLLDLALRCFRNFNWLYMPTFLSLTNISFCSAQFGNTTDLSSYLDLLLLLYSKHCYTTTNSIFLQKQVQNLCWINFTTPKTGSEHNSFISFFFLMLRQASVLSKGVFQCALEAQLKYPVQSVVARLYLPFTPSLKIPLSDHS